MNANESPWLNTIIICLHGDRHGMVVTKIFRRLNESYEIKVCFTLDKITLLQVNVFRHMPVTSKYYLNIVTKYSRFVT